MGIDVLVAEDEPSILESLNFILKREGWSVEAATDGESAIEMIQNLDPKVVVLDIMLPKRSGFEVLNHIRSQKAIQALPVLMLTAKGQQQDRRTAEELGADIFVTKPYANSDVVAAVRKLMNQVDG